MAKKLSEAQRTERRQKQADDIEKATRELLTSDGWARWARTRAKFHKYSIGNTMLIAWQCPEASHVAGFRKWLELGRQVRKGEKAITILGPVIVKCESTEKPGTYEKKCVGFKGVSVFDISQTDGDPLPEPVVEPITGDSHAAFLPKLKKLAKELDFKVVEESLVDVGGYCDPQRKVIAINRTDEVNKKVRVLVHELAHALGVGYKDYGRSAAEVIVETTTVIVCSSIGLDTTGESIPYIAGWGESGNLKAIKACAETVDEIARRIERACAV